MTSGLGCRHKDAQKTIVWKSIQGDTMKWCRVRAQRLGLGALLRRQREQGSTEARTQRSGLKTSPPLLPISSACTTCCTCRPSRTRCTCPRPPAGRRSRPQRAPRRCTSLHRCRSTYRSCAGSSPTSTTRCTCPKMPAGHRCRWCPVHCPGRTSNRHRREEWGWAWGWVPSRPVEAGKGKDGVGTVHAGKLAHFCHAWQAWARHALVR